MLTIALLVFLPLQAWAGIGAAMVSVETGQEARATTAITVPADTLADLAVASATTGNGTGIDGGDGGVTGSGCQDAQLPIQTIVQKVEGDVGFHVTPFEAVVLLVRQSLAAGSGATPRSGAVGVIDTAIKHRVYFQVNKMFISFKRRWGWTRPWTGRSA